MTPLVVVDVGNSRLKWGRCENHRVVEVVALPGDDPNAWRRQWQGWGFPKGWWGLGGSHPARLDIFRTWLIDQGQRPILIDDFAKLNLTMEVDSPQQVGLDRLFNALAVKSRRGHGPAAIIDAGTAVTVDLLDTQGAFRGGAIFPGLRLMAQALHDHTAMLPLVEIAEDHFPPGKNTVAALQAGIFQAVVGGIHRVVQSYQARGRSDLQVFLGGGDAHVLAGALSSPSVISWPEMTLEGIRLAVEQTTLARPPQV